MQDTTENYIHLEKVSKIYGTKEVKIIAVDEISFNIAKGEFAVIVGPSGAGKTTVLNILGGMDTVLPVDIYVPGCAARPEAIIDGVVKAVALLDEKRKAMREDKKEAGQ